LYFIIYCILLYYIL